MTKSKKTPEPQEGEIVSPAVVEPKQEEPTTETVVAVKTDSIQSLTSVMSTDQLKAAVAVQKEQRAILIEFVKDQLIEGSDFGKIHVSNNCQHKYELEKCKLSGHWSKDCLFKPGQEKIFSLLGITTKLKVDRDTLEMLGNPTGTIAYICEMFKGDVSLGEGRGSCSVGGGLNRDSNSATKIAEKRARMDACLTLGFSEFFTQDMDDPDYRRGAVDETGKSIDDTPTKAETPPPAPKPVMTANTRASREYISKLFTMIKDEGFSDRETITEIIRVNGFDPTRLTMGNIKDLAQRIKSKSYAIPARARQHTVDIVNDNDPILELEGEEFDKAFAESLDAAIGDDEGQTPPPAAPSEPIDPPAPTEAPEPTPAETTSSMVQEVFPGATQLNVKPTEPSLLTEDMKQDIMNRFLSLSLDGEDRIKRFLMLAYGSTSAPVTDQQWFDFDAYLQRVLDMDPSELDSLLS
jgi:hypothetical protein